ncbi:MAG: hypothetical protein Q4E75_01465 [bacterium]|nr:hypothetical protein [bacterium]
MKLKTGKINNINTKLIAGLLATGISLISLSGCTSINDIKYEKSQEGVVLAVSDDIDFQTLKDCYFVKVIDEQNNIYYTIILEDNHKILKTPKYYDLFTSKEVNYNNDSIIYGTLAYYITAMGLEQKSYSEEELKDLMEKIEDYENNLENNKKLVKEK